MSAIEAEAVFEDGLWVVGDETYLPSEWCQCGREPVVAKGLGSKCYHQRPEAKRAAYQAAYHQRPEVKAKRAAYQARPEVKAKKKRDQIARLEARIARLRSEIGQ